MMKRFIFTLFAAALFAGPASAPAWATDLIGGKVLYEWCAGTDTAENRALCKGFVMGAAEYFVVSEHEQGRYSSGQKDTSLMK